MDALQVRAILQRVCSILACIVLLNQCDGFVIASLAEGIAETSGDTVVGELLQDGEVSPADRGKGILENQLSDGEESHSFPGPNTESCSALHSQGIDRPLMILSTVDGRVVALDIQNAGQQQWSLDAGIGPLLSSSISQFEISSPEGVFKVIPSLNGGLFKWDGEVLEAVPFTAETLLSTSFKLSDEMVMVGGKEIHSFGINARTGKLQYMCGAGGCQFYGDEAADEEDILVVQHTRKTVRAVDQRNGAEKWNFSVGQHEVTFLKGKTPTIDDDLYFDEDDDVVCEPDDGDGLADEDFIPSVMVDMSAKVVFALGSNQQLLWTHQMETSIANAWTIQDGVVTQVDLFAPVTLGLTSEESPSITPFFSDHLNPMLYVGNHKEQLYVHPSTNTQSEVEAAAWAAQRGDADPREGTIMAPRVRWRPYAYTSVSRTPYLVSAQNEENLGAHGRGRDKQSKEVTVWNQYPFDNGYYLLHEQSPKEWKRPGSRGITETNESEDAGLEILFSTSVWTWWREILSTSILIAIGMQLLLHALKPRKKKKKNMFEKEKEEKTEEKMQTEKANDTTELSSSNDKSEKEFKSRFVSDFSQPECLGKGGFGIVFQAKNKIDENSYAVKRITLPNRKEARDKVLREARTLAILDHSGIVRYYNSWLEEPLLGWQENQDREIVGDSWSNTDLLSSVGTPALFNKNSELVRNKEQLLQQTGGKSSTDGKDRTRASPILRFDLDDCDEESKSRKDTEQRQVDQKGDKRNLGVESDLLFPGSVDGLSGRFDPGNDFEESGSFSIVFQGTEDQNGNDSICSVSNLNDSGEGTPMNASYLDESTSNQSTDTSENRTIEVPFQKYSENSVSIQNRNFDQSESFQIVFDDSGCSDRPGFSGNSSESTQSEQSRSSSPNNLLSTTDTHKHKTSEFDCNGMFRGITSSKSSRHDQSAQMKSIDTPAKVPKIYLYIQMQLCQRETLKDWLSTNTLSRDRNKVLHIFHQMLEACSYIHNCGMIHRDLKPSNIFFSLDGKVKVGDFGLVTAIDTGLENSDDEEEATAGLQHHTGKVGTQLYMSPEQLSGQNYDHKVDIFSLGLIFFELFHPFSTQMERIKVMCQAKKEELPRRFTKELPLEAKFARWLMSYNPDDRPHSEEITESLLCKDLYEDYVPPSTHNRRRRGTSNSSK